MSNILPTATLGRTGLQVTRLGFGSGHRRSMTDQEMDAQLNAVLDAGINFIDTANDYGNSEEMIGRFLRHRRDEFVLATKCGCHPDGHIWTRENLFRGLHESLERLRVDYLDVMQLHNPTVADCEQGELVDALQDMRTQGKVRWIGMSTTLPHLPTYLDWDVFDVYQIPYSALEREHENWLTTTAQAGAGTIIRGGAIEGTVQIGVVAPRAVAAADACSVQVQVKKVAVDADWQLRSVVQSELHDELGAVRCAGAQIGNLQLQTSDAGERSDIVGDGLPACCQGDEAQENKRDMGNTRHYRVFDQTYPA